MNDLITDLQHKLKMIDRAIDTLAKNGKQLAKSEMNYRIELAKTIFKLRADGVPVTIINDLARGDPKMAALRYDRDTNQAVYDANSKAIDAWKLEARIMEAQIGREWGRTE